MTAISADNGHSDKQPPEPVIDKPVDSVAGSGMTASPSSVQTSDINASTMVVRPMEETVRVTVGKLDRLMAEVSEMFVARMHGEEQARAIRELRRMHTRWQREWRSVRTAYIRLVRRLQDSEQEMSSELPILFRFLEFNQRSLLEANRHLAQVAHTIAQDNMRLATLADQLQDDIGGMRLIPFESIVGGFQRMVRDLARDTGKRITLDIEGATVEIDKAVLDSLKDPLMHVLRNAIDHAIETPEERQQVGKSPTGRIDIIVEQRGSEIVIHVADDGRGIDANKVRKSIVKNKLLTASEAANLNDDEVRSYIFYSGLSTSEKVTSISGRGLGMDIVRDRVESLRGRVSVQSDVGKGTMITLSVPVSLTRIRCILLRVGDQQFAVPSAMVMRMDKLPRDDIFTTEGRDMLMISERPIPVTTMGSILDIPSTGGLEDKISFVALQAADRVIAFEVDELFSEQELVLKPLGPELARARFVSGASLLGNGEVIIVLDANDLVRRASGAALPRRRAVAAEIVPTARRLRALVVDDSITTRTLEKNILETAGFDVSVAMDGVEAWSMLPQNDFDVIISDVEMPTMNGLELTLRIKSSVQFQGIPVILLTSLGKPEQREAGLRAGADAYLIKSRFDQGELLQTIQSVI
jgi:two-component system chemotaxis sensor kinase CheA